MFGMAVVLSQGPASITFTKFIKLMKFGWLGPRLCQAKPAEFNEYREFNILNKFSSGLALALSQGQVLQL
jgi:hypothetical protein